MGFLRAWLMSERGDREHPAWKLGDEQCCHCVPAGLRVCFSKLLLLCLNHSVNTHDCSTNNASHNHELSFLELN